MGILSSLWCKAHTLCRKRHNLYHVQICFQILNSFQTNNSHIICILISLTTPWLTSLNQTTTRYLFDMYISCKTRCFTIRDANINITLLWAYKRITTVVYTSFCVNQIRDTVEIPIPSNMRRTKSKTEKFLVSSWSCLCAIYWSLVSSGAWRCSWSSADTSEWSTFYYLLKCNLY